MIKSRLTLLPACPRHTCINSSKISHEMIITCFQTEPSLLVVLLVLLVFAITQDTVPAFLPELFQCDQKHFIIFFVLKNRLFVVSYQNNVINSRFTLYPSCSWHIFITSSKVSHEMNITRFRTELSLLLLLSLLIVSNFQNSF